MKPILQYVHRVASRVARVWTGAPASARIFAVGTLVLVAAGIAVSCQTTRPSDEGGVVSDVLGDEPTIRVRVVKNEKSAKVSADEGVIVTRVRTGEVVRGSEAAITSAAAGGRVSVDGRSVWFIGLDEPVLVRGVSAGSDLGLNDGAMPGLLEVRAGGDGVDVVAGVPMERYIEGVLAGELISGWPLATFQAQAVAARSYAMHERTRARAKERWFDVEATTLDQVFRGGSRWPQASSAVASTRGVVLTDRQGIIRAYFSSTCGGRPASAAGIWPSAGELVFNKAAALQGEPRRCTCEASPLYRWERERTPAELRARLRAWGERAGHPLKRAGEIASIEIGDVNKAGRADTYLVREANDNAHELLGDDLRTALNWAAKGQPETTRATRVASNDFVISREGRGPFVITGRGFGHGVGLCQWGAFGLASEGKAWREIATRYYPGARLARVW